MKSIRTKLVRNIVVLMAFLAVSFPAMAEETKSSLEKAAVVNGVVISQEEYAKELGFYLQRFSRQGLQLSKEQEAKLKNDVLENLIEREILYQESQKSGIKVDKKTVDEELSAVKKRFPSEKEYKNALNTMKISENEIKNQIKRKLSINKLIDTKIAQKVIVTDEESKAFYNANQNLFKKPEQLRIGQILIKLKAGADEQKKMEAMKKIKEVQAKLKGGQDFSVLAKAYSEDDDSNTNGGDLGYLTHGQMAKPIEDAAFGMQPNEVSDIIRTQLGYHLIKVYDKKPEKILAYGEIKDLLAEHMRKEKTEKEAAKYIDELMKDAKVERYR
jgi:peptidyl-prolyl cis-trans isomerase C